jgi:hypothetical protein
VVGSRGTALDGFCCVGAGTALCCGTASSTDVGTRGRAEAICRMKARKRKMPPPHQLAFVSRLPAWCEPRSESEEVEAPPKLVA